LEEEKQTQMQYTDDELTKRKEKCVKIRDEILSTEKTYVANLKSLNEHFLVKLKHAIEQEPKFRISDQQLADMTSNVPTLVQFHQMFYDDMVESNDPPAAIIKYGDYFKMYTRYMNDYDKAVQAINQQRKNKRYKAFVQAFEQSGEANNLDLMSFLIMPVQRVPRYVLLLRELKRHTQPDAPAYEVIKQAMKKVTGIAAAINETKRRVENMSKLMELQNRIAGDYPSLVQPHRSFLREGEAGSLETSGLLGSVKVKEYILFLFSDVLIWTTKGHQMQGKLNLASAVITDHRKDTPTFELSNSKVTLVLQFKDETEKESWKSSMADAIKDVQENRKRALRVKRVVVRRTKAHTDSFSGAKIGDGSLNGRESAASSVRTEGKENKEGGVDDEPQAVDVTAVITDSLQQLADDADGGPEGLEEEERNDYYADPSASHD